jgi:hypothetical protein
MRETRVVDLVSIGTLITATMSAVAAVGSWRSAKHSASIDEERRHAELRPQLALRIAASQDGSGTAVMYVTVTGPVDLPTPEKIRLRMMDMSSELRDEVLAIYAMGGFSYGRGETGAPGKIWGPWEFMGGLKPEPPLSFTFSTRYSWKIGFRFCRPTRWLPTFRMIREETAPKSRRRRRKVTAISFDGVLFYLAWFIGQRTRIMRGVRLNEVQVVRLSRTRLPDTDWAKDKDWASLYPPNLSQVLARCKFGKWKWRIELRATTGEEARHDPIINS